MNIRRRQLKLPDQLLQTISSLGQMSIDRFNVAFDAMRQNKNEEQSIQVIRNKAIRFLDALGHCEFDFERRKVFACPPLLVSLPVSGLPNAVLTGARVPSILKKIKEFADSNEEHVWCRCVQQRNRDLLLPKAIIIEALDLNHLQSLSLFANIKCNLEPPASWSLVNFSLCLQDIMKNLVYENRRDPYCSRRVFSEDGLKFSKNLKIKKSKSLIEYTHPDSLQMYHLIWDGEKAAEIDRDWGRYIILARSEIDVLLYDERRHLFAVPSTTPLPRFLGRAATLCSGLAPESACVGVGNKSVDRLPTRYDVYCSVPPAIAMLISKKLSQNLIRRNIIIDNNGVIE